MKITQEGKKKVFKVEAPKKADKKVKKQAVEPVENKKTIQEDN